MTSAAKRFSFSIIRLETTCPSTTGHLLIKQYWICLLRSIPCMAMRHAPRKRAILTSSRLFFISGIITLSRPDAPDIRSLEFVLHKQTPACSCKNHTQRLFVSQGILKQRRIRCILLLSQDVSTKLWYRTCLALRVCCE
jgi:hypothetical protein